MSLDESKVADCMANARFRLTLSLGSDASPVPDAQRLSPEGLSQVGIFMRLPTQRGEAMKPLVGAEWGNYRALCWPSSRSLARYDGYDLGLWRVLQGYQAALAQIAEKEIQAAQHHQLLCITIWLK